MSQARLQLPNRVAHGEVVKARLLVAHPMETGYLQDLSGKTIPRNVIRELTCDYGGRQVFRVEPSSGISGNPLFEFFFRARKPARCGCAGSTTRAKAVSCVSCFGCSRRSRTRRAEPCAGAVCCWAPGC